MKLPWDKNYLKISFHVIVTLIAIYAIALVLKNAPEVIMKVESFLAYIVNMLSPLIIAVIFSYIMNPAVEKLQGFCDKIFNIKHKGKFKKRIAGTAFLYIILFSGITLLLIFALTGIGTADIAIVEEKIRASVFGLTNTLKQLNVKLAEAGIIEKDSSIFDSVMGFLKTEITSFTSYFAQRATAIGSFALDLLIGLTAAFYFLMEKERILYSGRDYIKTFIPKHSDGVLDSLYEANRIFSGYIRGQITDAFVMASLISISFLIIGIDYPLVIGVISGFSNLIPYVGAIVAFVLSISVAFFSGTPIKALYAGIVVLLLQQLDSSVIAPRVVGNKVKLHPVFVILSLSVFGSIFGIWGMIFAVPVAAIIKVIFKRIYDKKKYNIPKHQNP
ncbi:MAG: AI-2E family transporter [Candidatus Metalachnospira sp.]|nr:AI-2E family transporter [Candidatus Metalachnospira sp.]